MMEVTQDGPENVLITEEAVLALAKYLEEVGRPKGRPMIMQVFERSLNRDWGTPRVRMSGGVWMLDLSDFLDNQEIYAVVRNVNGSRKIVGILDADEADVSQAAPPAKQPETSASAPQSISEPAKQSPRVDKDTDPGLLLWTDAEGKSESMRGSVGELKGLIADLVSQSVDTKSIELWTGLRKPKVQIDLE